MKFPVSPEKELQLLAEMERLGVREQDLEEHFIRGSGAGGQKRNKTSSAVQILHRPSGLEVRCQESRSQGLNRYLARRLLCARLEEKIAGIKSKKQAEIEKIRRQKRRRSRKQKEKMLASKHQRSETKQNRRKPTLREE